MPALSGPFAAFQATLHQSTKFANIKTATPTIVATASAPAITTGVNPKPTTEVEGLSSMGALDKTRAQITFPVYGKEFEGSISGQAAAVQFELGVTFDASNDRHKALRDDSGQTVYGWTIKMSIDGNTSYLIFNGTVGSAVIETPFDGVSNMTNTINLAGGWRWVDAT